MRSERQRRHWIEYRLKGILTDFIAFSTNDALSPEEQDLAAGLVLDVSRLFDKVKKGAKQ